MSIQAGGYIEDFELVFKTNFKQLHAYAYTFLQDNMQAEEIVQQVFVSLYERKVNIKIGNLRAFLYRSVHNGCINHIKKQKQRSDYFSQQNPEISKNEVSGPEIKELQKRIDQAVRELPEQCRLIFQLSRFEEMKNREIASHLQISIKTVEAQMSKALKILRGKLDDLLVLIIIIIILF